MKPFPSILVGLIKKIMPLPGNGVDIFGTGIAT